MKLVLAEKPSVGMSLAKVLGAHQRKDGYMEGGGYIVSWCIGHLVELAEPEAYDPRYARWNYEDLPIIPEQWHYRVSASTRKQFEVLKKLMFRDDISSLICATDAGREGELIFRLVYHQCRCRKPVERLWISSMEDEAIREGFANLRPGTEYDALYQAALCRERADWMVGINATRLFSCLYGNTLNVGRVMTPTLAMVVMRDAAINGFVPEPFYTVQLKLEGCTVSSERFKDKTEAEQLIQNCRTQGTAIITEVEQKEKAEHPPLLYDLTSLQRDANRAYGYTAQQTLDYTQSLYEKKLVTYPRTDSRYLTDDMEEKLPELVEKVLQVMQIDGIAEESRNAGKVCNSKKVSDHHAVIPTGSIQREIVEALPAGEKAILKLITVRLLCAMGDSHRYLETVLHVSCADQTFTTKGKTVLEQGWRAIQTAAFPPKLEKNPVAELPALAEHMTVPVDEVELKEGRTTAPKRFTEDTLLQSMETAGMEGQSEEVERRGIGTPATRAAVIEKLVQKGFVERKGDKKTKYLVATHKGIALVTVVPEQVQSPAMTADWEEKLLKMERGQYSPETFMQEIDDLVSELVKQYQVVKDAEVLMPRGGTVIGNCPACGSEVKETQKSFCCSNKACKFTLWKDNNFFKKLGKQMTAALAEKLVKEGKASLKSCYSAKTGRHYDATVLMTMDAEGRPVYALQFQNGGKKKA